MIDSYAVFVRSADGSLVHQKPWSQPEHFVYVLAGRLLMGEETYNHVFADPVTGDLTRRLAEAGGSLPTPTGGLSARLGGETDDDDEPAQVTVQSCACEDMPSAAIALRFHSAHPVVQRRSVACHAFPAARRDTHLSYVRGQSPVCDSFPCPP